VSADPRHARIHERASGDVRPTPARAEDARADAAFAKGAEAGSTSDKYTRVTVFLAIVLFLVAISSRLSQARLGLSALRG
jgi:hypothetical protein